MSISSKLKNILLSCCKKSTANGIPNIANSKKIFNKIFWLFYLCVFAILTAWYIVDSVNTYLRYEVVTKIERIYEQPIQFPTVSFCPVTGQKIFKNYSIFKDRLKDCSFNSDTGCMMSPERYFESFIHDYYGLCFRFNSGKNLNNNSIEFLNSTMGGKYDSFRLKIVCDLGLTIWIHNPFSPPKIEDFNNHDGTIIMVSPGFETHLIIDRVVDLSLAKPYNPCYKNVSDFELIRTIIDYFKTKNETYRQSNCFELCFDLDCLENSSCFCNSTLGNVWKECYINNRNNYTKNNIFDYRVNFYKNSLVEKCSKFCPLECDSISYDVSINSFKNENKVKNETEIYVYYRDLKYTSITQQPKMKVFDLISNIGGIFGLFISLSFVTLFEINELLFKILFINFIDQSDD